MILSNSLLKVNCCDKIQLIFAMKKYIKEYFKLLKFTKGYRALLALAAIVMSISTLFDGISLGMIAPLADRIFTNKQIVIPGKIPNFLSSIIEKLNAIEPMIFLKFMVVAIPVLFLIKGIFMVIQDFIMNVVGQGVVKEVRNKLYSKMQDLCMNFYGKKRTGELMSRISNDVAIISNAISYSLKDVILESMKLILFSFLTFYIGFKLSWKVPIVAFIIFPAIMFPVLRVGKKIKMFTIEVQKKMADLNSIMAETIQGAYVVKTFCREDYEIKRFKKINDDYYKFNLKTIKRIIFLSPLTELIGISGAMVILWLVGKEVISGRISFGVLASFLVVLMSMIKPIKKLSNAYALNQQAFGASSRIYDILEEETKVKELPNAEKINNFNENISFIDVSFAYNENEGCVLENINIEVTKGEVIALVGPSGAGKTTLVGLIPRLYDTQNGKILIDGKNLKDINIKSLRSLISIVSQDTVLFNASVRVNVAYGKDDATDEEIFVAAKKAHIYDFIMELPKQFDTIVGDRGIRLSGGQKQRIAIARAILKKGPILILDEATSHLDSESERLIKDALSILMEERTSFVIAHRLSTILKADRIIVLDKGKIVEIGTHEELLKNDGLYKKLYKLQFHI